MVGHTKDVEDLLAQARAHEHRLVLIERTDDKVYGEGIFARLNKAIAVKITVLFGSMWALYLLIAWILGWIAWQQSGVGLIIKDPYPFAFLLFLSNLIQLWALPAIMVGQNVLAAHADLRATADHETLELLHAINTIQLEILQKLQRAAIPGNAPGAALPLRVVGPIPRPSSRMGRLAASARTLHSCVGGSVSASHSSPSCSIRSITRNSRRSSPQVVRVRVMPTDADADLKTDRHTRTTDLHRRKL